MNKHIKLNNKSKYSTLQWNKFIIIFFFFFRNIIGFKYKIINNLLEIMCFAIAYIHFNWFSYLLLA